MFIPAPKTRITTYALLLCMFTLRMTAAPVASFTVNKNIGCAPLAVHFINNTTGANTYYWDLGNGNTSTLASPINVYTTPGTYSAKLIAYDSFGNSDTAILSNFITVVDKPVVDFTATDTAACLDGNLFSFVNGSIGGNSYLWDFGDGTTATDENPVHSFPSTGKYTVSLLVRNAYGCASTKTRTQYITIFPKPQASILVNSNVACDPSTAFQFGTNASSLIAWQWSFGDGSTSTQANPSHIYNSSGNFNVALQVTNTYGCRDTTEQDTVISILTKNWATFVANNDTGCAPFNVSFTAHNAFGSAYAWNFGDGSTSTKRYPDHVYASGGTYTVSLKITLPNGCMDSVTVPNYITVSDRPTVDFSISSSTGCSPDTVTFQNLSSNFSTCSWSFGNGSSSAQTNPTHIYTGAGNFNVTLTCTNTFGCSRTITKSNYVEVKSPAASFTATPRNGCPPLTVTFTNTSSSANQTYLWDFGDGNTSTLPNPANTYLTNGNFNVSLIVTDSNGCSKTLSKAAYVQTSELVLNYTPPPVINGCVPYTTNFTDNTPGVISWLWDFGDGTTSTLNNPSHTYTTAGLYTVSLTIQSAGGGCTQTISNFNSYNLQGGYAAFTDSFDQCPPYDAYFFDSSANAVSWLWNFGDGSTSTLQNPSHTFAVPGYHTVSLSIVTSNGCTYNSMKSNGIYFAPFGANFYSVPQSTTLPMPVNFYANSIGATGWFWDFGDSSYSTDENPQHIYLDTAEVNVTLTITNGLCTLFYDPPTIISSPPDTGAIKPPPVGATFVPQRGCAPFNVSFAYNVKGAVSWLWKFGDGDSATTKNPLHTYQYSGLFTVELVTADSFGTETNFVFDTIVRVNNTEAIFSYTQSPNCQNTQVALNNTSTGATNYLWDFGDGSTDTLSNPVHIYTSGKTNYIITLKAIDTLGCISTLSTSMFTNPVSPVLSSETDICGLDTVFFTSGLNNYSTYLWDFGDGTTDSVASPSHIYTTAGQFIPSLTVTDANACSQTYYLAYPITINLPIASFSTPVTQYCNKLNATFNNASANSNSWLWEFGDNTTSTSYQPSHLFDSAGTYTITLTAFNDGCSSAVTKINYLKIDTAHADFSYTLNTVCIPFTASFTDLSANAVSWKWDFADFDSSFAQNPVHLYDSIFPRKDISLAIVDVNGCKDTASVPRFAGPRVTINANSKSGCLPFTVQFTATMYWTSGFYWDFGDGTTSTKANPSHTYTSAGIYRPKLVALSMPQYGSCTDTIYLTDTIKVVDPSAAFSSPNLSACAPSLVQFNNLSIDADSYVWDFGDGFSSNKFDASHLYKTPGVYTVTLTAISGLGCADTIVKQEYIKVNGPQTDFTLSDTLGCTPFLVDYIDSSKGAITWLWNFGDGYTASSQNATHLYADSGSYTVTLITTDTSGCSSYFEYPNNIHVRPMPVADFSVSDTVDCGSLSIQITNQSAYYNSLIWNFGDSTTSVSTSPTHQYSNVGQYSLTLIATNNIGCSDTLTFPQKMIVQLPPVADFQASATQGCSPLYVSFGNLSIDTLGASYFWNFGNGVTSTDPNPISLFSDPGLYNISLSVTNSNGCSSSLTKAASIHVLDTLPPPVSEILSVSVKSDSSVEIIWENNAAIDLAAYKLYRYNPSTNTFENIYTDNNPNNSSFALTSSYLDSGLFTLKNTYTYKLQTLDVCGYTIGIDYLRAHTTINVEAQVNGFNTRISWNAYGGCSVSAYDIYRSSSSGNLQFIASVPGDSLAYTDSLFICPDTYTYQVVGMDLCSGTYNSTSDTCVGRPVNVYADQRVDMVRSTVVDNTYVLTEWLPPVVKPQSVVKYEIYRSSDNKTFNYLTSVSPQQTDYNDYDVDVESGSYFYKIIVVNSCGIQENLSDNTTTILLKGNKTEDRIIHLNWSPYDKWIDGVDHYEIERLNENGQWELIKRVNGSTTSTEFRDE